MISDKNLFIANLLVAAVSFGLGGFNSILGMFSLLVAAWCWKDWYKETQK